MICVSRGPGIWPLRLAKCQRRGEDGRSPGLRTFLLCAETRSSGSSDLLPTLERLGDRHAADLSRHLGEHEVVVFQRPTAV